MNRFSHYLSSLFTLAVLPAMAEHPRLETLLVTATRDKQQLQEVAASVGVLSQSELETVNPAHASELLNRIPGVNIVQLGSGGEGVAAAIRQPVSYSPVYLYLENGVPTRSAGFFNHNALYEVNTALGSGVEIIKGPGSALYGSDAMGAVINSLVALPAKEDRLSVNLEAGEYDAYRGQLRAASVQVNNSYTLNFSLGSDGSWRENNSGERQEMVVAWYHNFASRWQINTVLSASNVSMATGGSGLSVADYYQNPESAGNKIGFRDVQAVRISSALEYSDDDSSFTITPFVRSNSLLYVATWTLNSGRVQPAQPWCPSCSPALDSQDAHINDDGHDSIGLLLKYRKDLGEDSFVITGLDIDRSVGAQTQYYIERTDSDSGQYWLSYQRAAKLYDYEVDYLALSPYVHLEFQLSEKIRLSAGLRYDMIGYDYVDNIADSAQDPNHLRPYDQRVDFEHFSPKLGVVYDLSESINGYMAYRHAFRIPSSSQLFRAGDTADSTSLAPVKAASVEVGLRGNLGADTRFDLTVYEMSKKDEILSISDPQTGSRRNSNAGETSHRGIELGVERQITQRLEFGLAYTRAKHRFEDWVDRSGDYSGNTMPDAPESFANIRLNYRSDLLNGGYVEVEWVREGEHWLDEKNDNDDRTDDMDKYPGHNLLNLRVEYHLKTTVSLYARLLNVTDRRYAETTSKWGPSFTPGSPRILTLGIKADFK
jgi:iron complex outermembrane receptor protein